jgi:eukaryotic-like serine/threonine-protein kinase
MGSSAAQQEPDLAPGTMVGDYRIDHTIGIGGMAAVYQATQPVIGKRVAIKVLHRTKSETALNRFIKEARAVNLIGHPNIVDVFGFGMTDSGRAYLVMELLVGETLAVRIKRGPISLAETCDILIEVAHALEAAHEASVIHRDLKPENIFLAKRKEVASVKLLDFGIAKLIDGGEPGREDDTRPGVLIGTPRYISPEQVRGNVLDGRADVYALGVVAFELLAGRPPFSGAAGAYELFEKHAKLKPPKPSAFNMQLPELADDLIGHMLAKEPNERPSLPAIREVLGKLRLAPVATALAAQRAAAAAEPTDVHAAPSPAAIAAMSPEAPTTRTERALPPTPTVVELDRPSSTGVMETPTRQITFIELGSRRRRMILAAIGGAIAAGIAIAIATTGNKLPARSEAATPAAAAVAPPEPQVTPITAPAVSADAGLAAAAPAADEPAIELDPVAHTPVHVAPHARHVRPASASPAKPTDDDAVRSPFERAP